MPAPAPPLRYRFGVYEADPATGELRKQGIRIKVNIQPFQLLLLLLERPNQVLTREELSALLWPDGTFVDYEHGVNSAVNRIREALGDSARNPRFIETLARRGYRFIAPVERIAVERIAAERLAAEPMEAAEPTAAAKPTASPAIPPAVPSPSLLATPADLPATSHRTARTLFLLLQVLYLAFYIGALANLAEISDLVSPLSHPTEILAVLILTAALLIPVRIFLGTATLFKPPAFRARYLRLWPFLLPFDILWSLAPFLLLHHLSPGLALACTTPLVYAPFAQRSLILMGAAGA